MDNNTFFEVKNLTKRFGSLVAVDNVSFKLDRKEILGIIGPNGAGKTTLINLITNLIKPSSGKVFFKGEDITGLPPHKIVNKGIARTFQVPRPFSNLPLISNVRVAALSARASKAGEWIKRDVIRAKDALEFMGIDDKALEKTSTLSHGELKRLDIAVAISTQPELILLDEPFSGLTTSEAELLEKSIKLLRRGGRFGRLHTEGMSLIVIEHKTKHLMNIADRVIMLHSGKIFAEGTPEEIANNERVIELYLGKRGVIGA
jgi:branched-chain amino acid transport system ATP-binding protein